MRTSELVTNLVYFVTVEYATRMRVRMGLGWDEVIVQGD